MQRKMKFSSTTGRYFTKISKPRLTLSIRLVNLHILLSAHSFRGWPLRLVFFAPDVYKTWQRLTKDRLPLPLKEDHVSLDESAVLAADNARATGMEHSPCTGIRALDVTYNTCKQPLERSLQVLASSRPIKCSHCGEAVAPTSQYLLVCPHRGCGSVYHMDCLARHGQAKAEDLFLPLERQCLDCRETLHWIDLVKDVSLRTRGLREQTALFKRKGRKRAVNSSDEIASGLVQDLSASDDEQEDDDENTFRDDADDIVPASPDRDDGWNELSDIVAPEDEAEKTLSSSSMVALTERTHDPLMNASLNTWDDADVLD